LISDDAKGYLDKYTIKESVEDGTTIKLKYALAPNDLRVDRKTLEKEFLSIAELEGVADINELNSVLEKAVTLKNMLKNAERVDKVAKYISTHYRENVEPMGYKGFVVGVDREACALYKAALDKYLPPDYSEVVISCGGDKDPPLLRSFHITSEREKTVRKAFRRPNELPKILIVTEKLLTGFDAPLLYCMYLDKPMRDHVLLQAIARVNRPYEDKSGRSKPAGFVLDFIGIFDKLENALAFDSENVQAVVEGIEVLQERFTELIDEADQRFLSIAKGKKADKATEAVLEHFRDEDERKEFYEFFQDIQDIYEILTPSAFLRPFIPHFARLTRIYQVVRANYEHTIPVDKSFLRKTAKLVQIHTEASEIREPAKLYTLDNKTLARISESKDSDIQKVFNLLKTLHNHIVREAGKQPWLINIGDRAEAIVEAFKRRQQESRSTLAALEELVREVQRAENSRKETDLSPEAFAVLWYLNKEGFENAEIVAKAAEEAFSENPHWPKSSRQEREVRRELYKALVNVGADDIVEIATSIMRMLRRASA
jgi:type I restriction enzyme R subunit